MVQDTVPFDFSDVARRKAWPPTSKAQKSNIVTGAKVWSSKLFSMGHKFFVLARGFHIYPTKKMHFGILGVPIEPWGHLSSFYSKKLLFSDIFPKNQSLLGFCFSPALKIPCEFQTNGHRDLN